MWRSSFNCILASLRAGGSGPIWRARSYDFLYLGNMAPLLAFDRVSYRYPTGGSSSTENEAITLPALLNVSLAVEEGEFVSVVGANGSGKSTFMRLASALLLPQEGVVRVMGVDTRDPGSLAQVHANVGVVFQYPEDQIVGTTLEEDTAFGPENLGLPAGEIRERVESTLKTVGLWEHRQRSPHMLSAGQTQRLALAGVLAMRPRCILFDEASTMLDPAGRRTLVETMQRLNQEGITIIYVTHFMEEAALAKRMVVFHQGQVVLDGSPAQIFSNPAQLAELSLDLPPAARAADSLRSVLPQLPNDILTLADLENALPSGSQPGGDTRPVALEAGYHEGKPLIEVSDLHYVYLKGTPLAHKALNGVSLQVYTGEAHGLLGRTGSGKSTIMQHLNGLLRPQAGTVRVADFSLNDENLDRRQVVQQVGLVFQNPETQFFEHYVGDEIAFGPRQLRLTESTTETLADRVRWAMAQVGLGFEDYKDRPLLALSGGERRKVALASTLALKPSILLLDEPTAGLDPRSRQELLENLVAMQEAGMMVVLSSHQMEDMAVLTQALTVFDGGQEVLTGRTAAVFAQGDELRAHGLEPPIATQIAEILQRKGWAITRQVITLEALVSSLAEAQREARA